LATKSAGRVSIRVLPDSSRFREDLKKSLERIEKTTKATIPAHLEVTRESIRKLKEQLKELDVRIKVEPYVTQEQLHRLKDDIEDIDPDLRVGINALNARRQLATLGRTRFVTFIVRINKASVAAAASTLAALSGARILSNTFEPLFNRIKELDKIAPKIGFITTAVSGLASILLAGISNAAGLIGSLAAVGQAAVLLPTLFTTLGIAIGVAIAVFKDMKTVLKDLGPLFTDLQNSMSAEFWKIAADPIRDMVHTLMPSLKEQLINTSQALGVMTRELSRALKDNLTPKLLNESFDNMNQAIARASGAMRPLVSAFVTLGTFGTRYLPRLSAWLVDLSKKFNNFVQGAAKSGELTKWAERGIEELKALGRVVRETVRVFAALTKAASNAGGATFTELANGLKKLADIMNTPAFQTTLSTVFAGAHAAMDGLLQGINNLGPGLASFAPTLATVFKSVGDIFESLGDSLSKLLSNPVLQQGLQNFISGFKTFVSSLGPGMAPLGQIIGTLATAMGNLLAQAGPLISEALILLAPLFEKIWEAIKPLIPTLFSLVEELLPPFAEILMTLATDVLPEVVPLIADLAPVLVDLAKAMVPVIIQFLKDLGKFLHDIEPFIAGTADFFSSLAESLNLFPLALFQTFTGDKVEGFTTLFQAVSDHPEVPAFFTGLAAGLGSVFTAVDNASNFIGFMSSFAGIVTALTQPTTGIPALVPAIGTVTAVLPGWQVFWAGMSTAIAAFQTSGTIVLTVALNGLKALFPIFFTGVQGPWNIFWQGLAPVVTQHLAITQSGVSGGLAAISVQFGLFIATNLPKFPTFFGLVKTAFTVGMSGMGIAVAAGIPGIVRNFISMNAQNLATIAAGWNVIVGVVKQWMGRFVAAIEIGGALAIQTVTGIPAQMVLGLFQAVGDFFEAGASLITAFVQGISSGVNPAVAAAIGVIKAVQAVLPHSPAEKGPLSGQGWINLKKSGTAITRQFASGLTSDLTAVQNRAGQVVGAVQFNGANVSTSSARSAIGGARDDRALVTIEGDYYGATPEQVAKEFDTKLRRNGLASQIGKIGIG
jgi:class 3 adenylate cyclase